MVFVQFVIPRFTNNAYESQLEALSAPTSKFELKENISYKYYSTSKSNRTRNKKRSVIGFPCHRNWVWQRRFYSTSF